MSSFMRACQTKWIMTLLKCRRFFPRHVWLGSFSRYFSHCTFLQSINLNFMCWHNINSVASAYMLHNTWQNRLLEFIASNWTKTVNIYDRWLDELCNFLRIPIGNWLTEWQWIFRFDYNSIDALAFRWRTILRFSSFCTAYHRWKVFQARQKKNLCCAFGAAFNDPRRLSRRFTITSAAEIKRDFKFFTYRIFQVPLNAISCV